jgi:hypothetical protein
LRLTFRPSGGCCPSGFQCGRNSCTPPPGYSISGGDSASTLYCAIQGQTLCGAEFNYGCCGTDYYCGTSTCYPKTTTSFSLTITTVATVDGVPVTQTQVVQTYLMPKTQTTPLSSIVYKATPALPTDTAGTKNPAAKPTSLSSSGLSKSAVIGLVVGILVCMAVVVATTCLTLRRLKQASQHSEKRQSRHRQSGSRNQTTHQTSPLSHSDSDSGYHHPPATIVPTTDSSSRGRSNSNGPEDAPISPNSVPSRSRGNTQSSHYTLPTELHGSPVPQSQMPSRNSSTGHTILRYVQPFPRPLPDVAEASQTDLHNHRYA